MKVLYVYNIMYITYINTRLVISSTERQHTIISDIHKGLGQDSTIQKISNKFFWYKIKGNVKKFIKKCDQCQKQEKMKKYIK